jgi:hypothetical protein
MKKSKANVVWTGLIVLLSVLGIAALAGCKDDGGPSELPLQTGDITPLIGSWQSGFGDSFEIEPLTLEYAFFWMPEWGGVIRYVSDSTKKDGVIIIQYTQPTTYGGTWKESPAGSGEYVQVGGMQPPGSFQGIFWKNFNPVTGEIQLAQAFEADYPFAETVTLEEALVKFTLDYADLTIAYWGTYTRD